MADVQRDGQWGREGAKPRARGRRQCVQTNPPVPSTASVPSDEQPEPWLAYVNLVLEHPLPLSPSDSDGFAAMRWLFYHALAAHLEGDAQTEATALQALVFISQHYAKKAYQHLQYQRIAASSSSA